MNAVVEPCLCECPLKTKRPTLFLLNSFVGLVLSLS